MGKIVVSQAQLKYVPPQELVMNGQVRVDRDADKDAELVRSIEVFGVLQPIGVRQVGGKFVVTHGHRRTQAAIAAKLPSVPVIVEQFDGEELTARQLIENMHRDDLSLKDQANGVRKLYEQHGAACLVAEMLGKSRPWVSKQLTLTAEGKSSLARKLIEDDELGDLELAYLLCRLEEANYDAARRLYHLHQHAIAGRPDGRLLTREAVQIELNKAKRAAEKADEDANDDEGDADTGPSAKAPGIKFTPAEVMMIQNAVQQYTPRPDENPLKVSILAKLSA